MEGMMRRQQEEGMRRSRRLQPRELGRAKGRLVGVEGGVAGTLGVVGVEVGIGVVVGRVVVVGVVGVVGVDIRALWT
jgi:hypothetical protein